MQVTVESTNTLGRRMTVAVPAERLEGEIAARLKRLSQKVRFPGFRPGKAPMKMVEAQYGGQAMEEAVGDLIRATFYEAVQTRGLKPAGGPNIEPKPVNRGQDFEYTATFEVYPEIKRLEISGSKIERPVVNVSDDDVNRTLETLQRQRQTWKSVERAAQNGDRVVIDFQGKIGGEVFPGGTASDFPLVLGSHSLIDGFEDGIVGAKSGESRTLDLTFPVGYHKADLAGRKVQFDVTLKQVNEPELPEINEDFARTFGIADGNVETLRAEVRANLEHELADRLRRHVREKVFQALIDANDFEVPKALEDEEIGRMIQSARQNFQAQGLPPEQVPADPALYAQQARSRVKLGLVLAEFVSVRKLTADATKVRARVESLASTYQDPKSFVEWHYAKPGRLSDIESLLMEEQAVDLLLETAELVDTAMSFQELTQPSPRKF